MSTVVPSREAVDLALDLFDVAQRRARRGENNPTHVIAVALQTFMDREAAWKAAVAELMEAS
jgi:predicted transcriptional regulator